MQIDNPNVELVDGAYTDMMIENIIAHIHKEHYSEHFDGAFTVMVQQYINPDCPNLLASVAGRDLANAGIMHYFAMLGLDYLVIHRSGNYWPEGGFEEVPDASFAISVMYEDCSDGESTDYAPGRSLNQAALAALAEYARQIAYRIHNEPELPLDPRRLN